MHDLETRIAAWRASMLTALRDEETMRELEEHLREDVAMLQRGGMTEAEAFARAVARLGDRKALAREFARSRSRWFGAAGSRGMELMAYAAGALGLVGVFLLMPQLISLFGAALSGTRLRGDPVPGFTLALVVTWMAACLGTLRASRRYLERPNSTDARGVVAFNLLAIWMLTGWCLGPSALPYVAKLAVVFLSFGGLLLLWWTWLPHLCKHGFIADYPKR